MNLFTIAPDQDFLDVLADAMLAGFPLEADDARPPLSRWTVLVPTRRAARSLQAVLASKMKAKAFVLPRIRPFGDVDEEELFAGLPEDGIEDAISSAGQLHLLLGLVRDWAAANPHENVARDLIGAPEQQLQMALSLQQLVNQMETEEADFSKLAATYDLELAFHRSAVLSLFEMLAVDYQRRLRDEKLMGPSARRNRLIRMQAERLAAQGASGPVIAAGSTGSNPATRRLLQVISTLPQGAVIFPGLDAALDDHVIGPEHPQFAMATTLREWSVPFATATTLGPPAGGRSQLAWAALRPAGTVASPVAAHGGLTLMQARDQTEEALSIALRLRQHAVQGEGPAALITPDRTLAARVQAALARWHIRADDSAGEALAERGLGSLLLMLLEARRAGFAAMAVLPLLHHRDCTLGLSREESKRFSALLEIACVRGMPFGVSLADFAHLAAKARKEAVENRHAPMVLKRATADEWDGLAGYIARATTVFQVPGGIAPLTEHLGWMDATLAALAPEADDDTSHAVRELLEGLKSDSRFAPPMLFDDAALLVAHHLRRATLRAPLRSAAKIFILGLLEARLIPLDLAILGGLNEGNWPAVPETGPWLNRGMRKAVGLQMPERDIGLTAHDFVQGLCRGNVLLTWSERLGGKPSLPSRLVLRLRSTLEAQGVAAEMQLDQRFVHLARALDQPSDFAPQRRPLARPVVAARPRTFSVTEIEKLVRDSYHIHARRILELEPLRDAQSEPDYALRGSLIHAALAAWAHDPFTDDMAGNVRWLLKRGREAFAPYMHLPEVSRFWWVRFQRMARALVLEEAKLRADLMDVKTELRGQHDFAAAGAPHVLSARADRIDILRDGALRFIDYKSGGIPTSKQVEAGFAPQLPLEAAIASRGQFQGMAQASTRAAMYIGVSGGGSKPVKVNEVSDDVMALANKLFAQLEALLAAFQNLGTAYVPRHNLTLEGQATDYDHLSRRAEWELSAGGDA